MNEKNVLEIRNLKTYFYTDNGVIHAVDDLSLDLEKGSTLGIVGESGSGKSVTALSIMGLFKGTTGRIVDGSIMFRSSELETDEFGNNREKIIDLSKLSDAEHRKIRGKDISMIFQEPMTSLNPVLKIGDQIEEAIILHQGKTRTEAREMALEIMNDTGLPRVESMIDEYPYELSGGQRQRVMIAMALACHPRILIADEPTTALDVTIQAQIIDLIIKLKEKIGMSVIFITHSLGVVAEICDKVSVMYCSRAMENGTAYDIFKNPKHPYTEGLMNSIPKLGLNVNRLYTIPGNVPNPKYMPEGCKFAPRCDRAIEICTKEEPPFADYGNGHTSRCWLCQKNYGGEL